MDARTFLQTHNSPGRLVSIWHDCPRISADFIADEERAMGKAWIQQEYECLFTALEGLVYPDFDLTVTDEVTSIGKPVGGIDWGWRNPFAAVWGVLDREDVLWIQNERYLRQTPLHEHARALPKIVWYADPAGATEMCEFRAAVRSISSDALDASVRRTCVGPEQVLSGLNCRA